MKIGYKQKLLFTVTVLVSVTFFVLTLNRISILKGLMMERILNRINSMGNLLAEEIKDNLVDNEITDLRESLAIADKQDNISFVNVIDDRGEIVYSSQDKMENTKNILKDSSELDLKEDLFVKSFNIIKKKQVVASVQIGFSLNDVSEDLVSALNSSIIISLLGLLIVISGSWYISGRLLSPLEIYQKLRPIMPKVILQKGSQ